MLHVHDKPRANVNFLAFLSDPKSGEVVKGSIRRGHNVLTTAGQNWLTKLVAWQTIAATDIPYTHRRIRWMGVGIGSKLEVAGVETLDTPVAYSAGGDFLAPISSVDHPTSGSVRFTRVYATTEITTTPGTVAVTEAGLFPDVSPYSAGGTEDTQAPGYNTTLAPNVGTNPPAAYKAFEAINKTQSFALTIRWTLRFS
jgi:hypothetical protein